MPAARPCRPRLTAAEGPPEHRARIVRARSRSSAPRERGALALALAVASARRSALLCRGPYGAAGGWRKVRRMARRDAGQFFAGTGVPSKNPGTRPRTRSPWMGAGRAIGVASLLATFLWPRREK